MKKIKTETILQAVNLLRNARLTNMESVEDKYTVIKNLKVMKHTADDFDEFREDMLNKLKAEDHKQMVDKFRKMQFEEMCIKKGVRKTFSLPAEDMLKVSEYIKNYDTQVENGLKPEAEKLVDVEITPLSDESIMQLISSNDWTGDNCILIDELFSK